MSNDLSTVQILALYTLASPSERLVYGLPVVNVVGEFVYRGLVRKGLVRTVDVGEGEAFLLTDLGVGRLAREVRPTG